MAFVTAGSRERGPATAAGGRRGRRRALALAALAIALAGCGDDGGDDPAPVGVGELRVGSVAPLAQCRDWRTGSQEQRQATIADIRRQINLQDTPTPTPELTDAQAQRVFDTACADDYAAGFRLYKLYARAAAFHSLPE